MLGVECSKFSKTRTRPVWICGWRGFLTQTGRGPSLRLGMIARVTLELALRREFDYLIPSSLQGQVEVGTRVQVPLGARKVMGFVTAVAETCAHPTRQA